MNSQVYLMLPRETLPANELGVAKFIKTFPKSLIRGDSLDVPFLNCIKCHSFGHTIGGDGGMNYSDAGQKYWSDKEKSKKDASAVASAMSRRLDTFSMEDDSGEPGVLAGSLPKHQPVTFSKTLDSASPQLSFACSSQERFPSAIFFLRRKTGFGIAGVKHPHTVIGYRNCMISKWETDGDTETVNLKYEHMGMVSFLQIADTPVPQGASWRQWDTVNDTGSDAGWIKLITLITAGIIAVAGAAVGGAAALRSGDAKALME